MSFAQNRAETRPAMFRNRFLELHGALSHFRVDSPETRLQARIEIGGAPVDVDLTQYPRASGVSRHTADARDLLHALADSGGTVTAGVLRVKDGARLHWLIAGKRYLIPPSADRLVDEGRRALARRLPWAVLFTVIALAGWPLLKWSVHLDGFLGVLTTFAFVVCLLCSVPALVLLVLVLQALQMLFQGLVSPSSRRSWKALQVALHSIRPATAVPPKARQAIKRADRGPPDPDPDPNPNPPPPDTSAAPPLRRLRGRAHAIKVTAASAGGGHWLPTSSGAVRISNRLEFRRYEFNLDQQPVVLFAGDNWRDGRLFLAEGDRVEVIASAPQPPGPQSSQLALALHNLEDDAWYAFHRVMWPVAKELRREFLGDARMTFFTRYHARGISRMGCTLSPVLLAIGLLVGWMANDYAYWWLFAAVTIPGVFASQYVPCWTLDAFWRLGLASAAQRLTERVYRTLGAGHPLRPTREVTES